MCPVRASVHRLLARQLARHLGSAELGPALAALVGDVDRAYRQADGERELLERSLELTSQELLDRNQELTTAMRQSGIAVWSWDRVVGQLTMVGYGPVGFPELAGRGVFTLDEVVARVVVEDRGALVAEPAAPQLRRGPIDVRVRVHDGDRVRWVRIRGQWQGEHDRWLGVWIDVTDEVEARLGEHRRRHRLVRQHQSLQRLAQLSVDGGDFTAHAEAIVEDVERTLEVADARILLLDDDGSHLRCATCRKGTSFAAADFPDYFAALGRERTLVWDDVTAGPADARAAWARKVGLSALLDAPCRIGGRVVGVVSCMHVGGGRAWTPEEQAFVASVADVVSLAIEGQRRQRAEAVQAQLAESLRQAQKMESIGLLAGGVAHDFNNLLTPILMCAELVRDEAGRGTRHGELMDTVVGAALAARDLVAQLLAFSRKQVLKLEPVDLGNECRRIARLLDRTLPEKVEVVVEVADDLPLVRADPAQLQQVLLNLAVNARDAMPAGGVLTVRARPAPDGAAQAVLEVSDTGVGMEPDVVRHIFEPFFTTKGMGRGTGLGLSTVYGIVQQHEGTITVDSEPGRGTRFEVRLPAAAARVKKVTARPVVRPSPSVGTVLVVDDEPAVRALVTRVLRRDGFVVLEADGPRSAIELAGAHAGDIDLVVTDVSMPEMNGVTMVERLLVERPGLRVMYTSGYDRDGLADVAQPPHEARLLRKPFSVGDLVAAVREVVAGPRLARTG